MKFFSIRQFFPVFVLLLIATHWCSGAQLQGPAQFHQLTFGSGAIVVCDDITITRENNARKHDVQTKDEATANIVHGVADSCISLGAALTSKDKKKRKKGFFKFLCAVFSTILTVMANKKDSKKSFDQEVVIDITHMTCDFLAIAQQEDYKLRCSTQPSYLSQIDLIKNRTTQEQAIMRLMQSDNKDLFIAELCQELNIFLCTGITAELKELQEVLFTEKTQN